MKKSDIYEIAIRILGLYLFIDVIGAFRDMLTAFAVMIEDPQYSPVTFLVTAISIFLLLLVFSLFLIFKNKTVTKLICKASDFEEDAKLFASPKAIYEMAIVLSGLLLIIWTLPDFAVKLKNYISVEQTQGWHTNIDKNFLLTSGIKLVAGLFAIVSAKPLAKYFGRNKKQPGDPDRND